MPPLTPEDPVTRVGGRYKLVKRLGSGGMGVVYLAESPTGRRVAIKMIRPEKVSPDFSRRFRHEIAAVRVMGAWTAPIVEVGLHDNPPWYASEYLPVPDLQQMVQDRGPLSPEKLLPVAGGLAEALAVAHRAGLVHRDLKPANVLVGTDGPRLIDFGIAGSLDPGDRTSITPTGWLVGTPGYVPSERYRGMPADTAGDVFALGAVLVYAATGHAAFRGDGEQIARQVLEGRPDLSGVPEVLLPYVRRCLAVDPELRPTPDQLMRLPGWGAGSSAGTGIREEDIARTRPYRKVPFVGHMNSPPDSPPNPTPSRSPRGDAMPDQSPDQPPDQSPNESPNESPLPWTAATAAAALPGFGTSALLLGMTPLPWSASLVIGGIGFVMSLAAVVAGGSTDADNGDAAGAAASGCLAVPCGLIAVILLLVDSTLPWWGSVLTGLGAGFGLVVIAVAMPFLLRQLLGPTAISTGGASAVGFVFGVLTCALLRWAADLSYWVAVPVGLLVWPVLAVCVSWIGSPRPIERMIRPRG